MKKIFETAEEAIEPLIAISNSRLGDNGNIFERIIKTEAAADRMGVTPDAVVKWIKKGQLPAVKVGRDWLIEENDLQKVVDRPGPGRPKKER